MFKFKMREIASLSRMLHNVNPCVYQVFVYVWRQLIACLAKIHTGVWQILQNLEETHTHTVAGERLTVKHPKLK